MDSHGPTIDDLHAAPPPLNSVFLQGDGSFSLAIVGESKYAESLERICGRRTRKGVNLVTSASLVIEDGNPHDPMAVRVDIKGLTVGYLKRDKARLYRERLGRFCPSGAHAICYARIRGGWDRGANDQGDYGVQLDVDLNRANSAAVGARPPEPPTARMGALDSALRWVGIGVVVVVACLVVTCFALASRAAAIPRPIHPTTTVAGR